MSTTTWQLSDFDPFLNQIGIYENKAKSSLEASATGAISTQGLVTLQYQFNFLEMMTNIGSSITSTLKGLVSTICQKI